MSTVLKIKNTSADKAPESGGSPVLATGELAYSYAASSQSNDGGRLYIGVGAETNGLAADLQIIGGEYFTTMLDHVHGTLTADSAVIVDSSSKINQWFVDNLVMDGNTISIDQVTDANGNLSIIPGGTGAVVITADDIQLNGAMAFTGDQTITGNLLVTGTGKGILHVDGHSTLASATVEDLTASRVTYAGTGGRLVDDSGFTYTGTGATGVLQLVGGINVDVQAVLASANIEDLTNNRIVIAGVDGELEDDGEFTFDGTTFKVGASSDLFTVAAASGNTRVKGTLTVDSAVSFTSTSGTVLNVDGQADIASLKVEDLTATRVVFVGSGGELVDNTNLTFDSSTQKLDLTGSLEVDNITLDSSTISTTSGDLTIAPNANSLVDFSNNSAIKIPVGTTTERPTGATGQIRYNTTTSQFEGYSGSAWQGMGGVIDNDRDTYIVTKDNMGGLTIPSSPADNVLYFVTGGTWMASLSTTNGFRVDDADGTNGYIQLNNKTISSSDSQLILDPGNTGAATPTGKVTVYGDLEVMGTTTTVNSTVVTIDDPVFTLGGDGVGVDDSKDRGIEFKWHDGTNAKVGFYGWDESASRFVFAGDVNNTAEVFSWSALADVEMGKAIVDDITFSSGNFTATSIPYINASGEMEFLQETSTNYGTQGQVLQMDTSGVPFFGHIDCGTY